MGLFSKNKQSHQEKINWNRITSTEELEAAFQESSNKPSLFFKHSTRCSISSMALNRFESNWDNNEKPCNLYFIDLIAHRDVSNLLADKADVVHQSPQVILVKDQKAAFSASHGGISANEILEKI